MNKKLILVLAIAAYGVWYLNSPTLYKGREDFMGASLIVAREALLSGDVPVGAVIVEDDTIIAKACNTVMKNGNVAEHAEINAISEVFRKSGKRNIGMRNLTLFTTFEPCEMCEGAIRHYGIKMVVVLKQKGIKDQIVRFRSSLRYVMNKYYVTDKGQQDSLFAKHH